MEKHSICSTKAALNGIFFHNTEDSLEGDVKYAEKQREKLDSLSVVNVTRLYKFIIMKS